MLRKLVARLTQVAQEMQLDIALVTPDPAVHAAAQYARLRLMPPLPGRLEETAKELARSARGGHLALLVGAGVSAAAGLPSWGNLIADLEEEYALDPPSTGSDMSLTDRAELIEHVARGRFQQGIAKRVADARPSSLPQVLLAGLDCREVVTTNYDRLYEQAVEATGRGIATVMPRGSAQGADRWILKLHGDVEHPNDIVLTRRHMVRYDAANRPSASVLQSLLLTKRLLAVGVSMTDDNVIRLVHEVDAYRTEYGVQGTFGTVHVGPHRVPRRPQLLVAAGREVRGAARRPRRCASGQRGARGVPATQGDARVEVAAPARSARAARCGVGALIGR